MSATRINSPTRVQRDLLWTNTSPSSDFAAQTVQIAGVGSYDEVQVYVRLHKSYPSAKPFMVQPGTWSTMTWASSGVGGNGQAYTYMWMRAFVVNANSVEYRATYAKNLMDNAAATVANDRMIPYQVYGVKYL